eukprot:TRINITY_DN18592_c0_g1_i1.p1 TRINITY_DN18592_c0_g1~~TRINITY_DN18592_c0_g1_i1.p1  ORF type:complete len:143 (+),score=44.54 TRINITY_DN18592_c0_g1_i1:34-429(+)
MGLSEGTGVMMKELGLLEDERTALLKEENHQQLWNTELHQRVLKSPPPRDFFSSPIRDTTRDPPPFSSVHTRSPPPASPSPEDVVTSLATYLFHLPESYPITEEQVNAAFKKMLQLRVARDEHLVRSYSPR